MNVSNVDALSVIAWAVAGAWIAVIAVFIRASCKQTPLRPIGDHVDTPGLPRLSVIVAARNETECIESCIRSLFLQDYPDFEVIAVNDRSTDNTGEILERLAKEFTGRLRVLHVSNLAEGWFGKPHALTFGLQHATGELFCFTDADCEFQAPSALRTTVDEFFRRNLDFFSVVPKYSMTSLRECVAVPCCSEMLMASLRPERMDDPRWPDAFANGAFILMRPAPFERIGGWGAVRTQICEDSQLARLAKRSGLRVGMSQAEGLYQTRSYHSVRDSWNGWSRIFKGVLTPIQLLITIGRMLVLFALPFAAVTWGAVEVVRTGTFEWLRGSAGLGFTVAFGLRCALDVMVFRLVGAPIAAALLAPLGRVFVIVAATRALFSHAGLVHTHWRGATFCAGQLVMPRPSKPAPQIQ